jgi:hypothetical protein
MKKKYMKPTMREFRIQHHRIICTSPPQIQNNRFVDDPDWKWDEGGGQ